MPRVANDQTGQPRGRGVAGLPELTVKLRSGAASTIWPMLARERRAPGTALKGMGGKLKIFLFLVEIFLER